jgi:hypothetical protein
MMGAVRTSETSVYFYETTRAASQKTVIFMLAAVRPDISLDSCYLPLLLC